MTCHTSPMDSGAVPFERVEGDAADTTIDEQVESMYARLGLATAADRARFLPTASASTMHFDVVVTTTSTPFGR